MRHPDQEKLAQIYYRLRMWFGIFALLFIFCFKVFRYHESQMLWWFPLGITSFFWGIGHLIWVQINAWCWNTVWLESKGFRKTEPYVGTIQANPWTYRGTLLLGMFFLGFGVWACMTSIDKACKLSLFLDWLPPIVCQLSEQCSKNLNQARLYLE